MPDTMIDNPFLEQLARRLDGDRQAMSRTQEIFRGMIDRKLWKQMRASEDLPLSIDNVEKFLSGKNIFFRQIELSDGWWNRCTGRMMGFLAGDDMPVLLTPGFSTYTFRHPRTGKVIKVNKHTDLLKPEALTLCYPLPDEPKLKNIVRYVLDRLSGYDAFYSLLACVGVILLTMFTPHVCKMIFSEIIPSGDAHQIMPVATLLVGAAIGLMMVQTARNLVVVRIKDKVEYALQTAMISRLLLLPASFVKTYIPGDLSNRVLSVSRISSNLTASFLSTILTFLFSGIMFIQFFIYGGPLLYTGLAAISLMLVSILLQFYYTRKVQMNVNASSSHLIGTLFSLFSGIQKIKTCGAEFRAFHQWAVAYAPTEVNSSYQPLASFFINAVSYCLKLLPMIITMWAAWHYQLPLSDYIAYCAVLLLVCGAVDQLQSITKDVSRLLPELQLCKPILDAKPEIANDSIVLKGITGAVDIRGLKFRYSDDTPLIFDGLDLHINSGDYVAFIGTSGCGKSTLIRLMLGLEHPQAGSIFYDQYNLSEINLRSFRQFCISICLQDGKLIEGTILDNIIFDRSTKCSSQDENLLLTEEDAWEAARMAALDKDIQQLPLGMNTPISADGKGVSGGQRQRILIARALVRKPRILFLDEATSALDNISQHIVTESLANLKCTRIVIAHRLSTIKQCNRVILLRDGRVAADGSYEEVKDLLRIENQEL
jgi:ABC-type bacteriocin/lantibiotic exporter with double-glycine peptidase domain